MEGKGENKGTKRRPKTRMEQPEEMWAREKLVSVSLKSSSEILQGLSSFLLLFWQKSTQTRQWSLAMHQNMMITQTHNSRISAQGHHHVHEEEITFLVTFRRPGPTYSSVKTSVEKCWRFCLAFPEGGQNPSDPLQRRKEIPKVYFKMETNTSVTCESTPLVGEKSEQPLKPLISLQNE